MRIEKKKNFNGSGTGRAANQHYAGRLARPKGKQVTQKASATGWNPRKFPVAGHRSSATNLGGKPKYRLGRRGRDTLPATKGESARVMITNLSLPQFFADGHTRWRWGKKSDKFAIRSNEDETEE